MQKYIVEVKIPGTLGMAQPDPDGNPDTKIAVVDNIIADFIAGKGTITELQPFHATIDNNRSNGNAESVGTFVDIVLELRKGLVNDYTKHTREIIARALHALQAPETNITYFWTRGKQARIGFMETVPIRI